MGVVKIKIDGQIRSGKNNMMVSPTGHHYPNRSWAAWRDQAVWQVVAQKNGHKLIENPCVLNVEYWPADERRRDVSGMLDALFHVLERAGIVKDDSLFKNINWTTMEKDKKTPCVVLTINSEGMKP